MTTIIASIFCMLTMGLAQCFIKNITFNFLDNLMQNCYPCFTDVEPRLREGKWPAQSHTAYKWKSQDSNLYLLSPWSFCYIASLQKENCLQFSYAFLAM